VIDPRSDTPTTATAAMTSPIARPAKANTRNEKVGLSIAPIIRATRLTSDRPSLWFWKNPLPAFGRNKLRLKGLQRSIVAGAHR
jgi:hypothetical protein